MASPHWRRSRRPQNVAVDFLSLAGAVDEKVDGDIDASVDDTLDILIRKTNIIVYYLTYRK